MTKESFNVSINIPEIADFEKKYPQYGPFVKENKKITFNIVMKPINFLRCQIATELNLPAVAGVADVCFKEVSKQKDIQFNGFFKQLIGALVCCLMEANGFEKTGKKKSIPHSAFTKGEFYQKCKGVYD